ncbi:hypothetical protein MKW94_025072 [Papaver nudicaule]|uniref:Uncharacterized protein n=1 Tax=Papaver nudicaule TaxID=74823 RepID=A0AA41UZ62_PAPNU|nr:hypothetical protein [Papaver nudicaule]
MACLEMFNSDQHQCTNLSSTPPPMSPRISFSNDFVDTQQQQQQQQQRQISDSSALPKVSSNFEFSISNFNMNQSSADEIFSKGRILPFKQDINKTTTLRDELLNDDEDDDNTFSLMSRPPKGPIRWRDFLRLNKRNHILSSKSKSDHHHLSKVSDGGFTMESVIEGNEDEELHASKIPVKEGLKDTSDDIIGTNSRENVEIGI